MRPYWRQMGETSFDALMIEIDEISRCKAGMDVVYDALHGFRMSLGSH